MGIGEPNSYPTPNVNILMPFFLAFKTNSFEKLLWSSPSEINTNILLVFYEFKCSQVCGYQGSTIWR